MADVIYSLQQQIDEYQESLRLIDERMSEYVQVTDIPLQSVKEQRRLQERIAELESRLEALRQAPNPYRGLQPFEAEHSQYFFGREAMTDRLVGRVTEQDLVVVIGPSGSGKSSLLRAGLISEIGKGVLPGSQTWAVEIFKPGAEPLRSLAAALTPYLDPNKTAVDQMAEARNLAERLLKGDLTMAGDVMPALRQYKPQPPHFLLIIDQFEELFDPRVDDIARQTFLDALLSSDSAGWLKLVVAVRADFFDRLSEDRRLGERVDAGLLNVLPMSMEERRAAIEKPALINGRRFEEGLVDRMLDAAGEGAGSLPLLEFTLTQLWQHQTGDGLLTHQAYETIGEVSGAIANHATAVYNKLASEERDQSRRLFKRLVRVAGRDEALVEAVRRRINMEDLDDSTQTLVRTCLATQLLLITDRDSVSGDETVELVHEALITNWQPLQNWLTEDLPGLRVHQALSEAVEIWERYDRQKDDLYRGQRLQEAEAWTQQHPDEVSEREQAFLEASLSAQRQRRTVILAPTLFGLLLLLVVSVVVIKLVQESQKPDIPMQANDFNIAIAPFLVSEGAESDPGLLQDLNRDAEALSQETAELLDTNKAKLEDELGKEVVVLEPRYWPDYLPLENQAEDLLAQHAVSLTADILVFGEISPGTGRQWMVTPRFYVHDRTTQARSSEISSRHALGQPIPYLPGNQQAISQVMSALEPRFDLLGDILVGLSFYDQGDQTGYEQAATILCPTHDELTATGQENIGQEIAFFFCGQAKSSLAWLQRDDPTRYQQLMDEGLLAYEQGLAVNPSYGRNLVGTGSTLLQLGAPWLIPTQNAFCSGGDQETMDQARNAFERARTILDEQPEVADGTIMTIWRGLGIYHFFAACLNPLQASSHWEDADQYLNSVVDRRASSSARSDIVNYLAAEAMLYQGFISLWPTLSGAIPPPEGFNEPDHPISKAAAKYDQALRLLGQIGDELSISQKATWMPYALTSFCLNRQSDLAIEHFNELTENPGYQDLTLDSMLHPALKELCGL